MTNYEKYLGPIYILAFLLCMGIVGIVATFIFPYTEVLGVIWLLVGAVGSMYVAGTIKIYVEDHFQKFND